MSCMIKINNKCKQYKKEDRMTRNSIDLQLMRLADKIISQGKNIKSIFNDDSIIYDRINDEMYIYKGHGVNNIQLRIVYSFKNDNGNLIMYLIDYTVKKKNNKHYISEMNEKFKNMKLSEMTFSLIAS